MSGIYPVGVLPVGVGDDFEFNAVASYTYVASGGAQSGGAAAFVQGITYVASGGAQSGGAAAFVQGITYVASGGAQSGGAAEVLRTFSYVYVATGGARAGGTAFVIGRGVGGLLTVRLHGVAGAAQVGAVVRAQRLRVGGTRQTVIVPDLAQATTDADGVAVLTLMPSLGDAYRVTAVSARGEPLLDVSVLVGPGDAELHQLPPVEDMLAWH